jgi:hypothetical protein
MGGLHSQEDAVMKSHLARSMPGHFTVIMELTEMQMEEAKGPHTRAPLIIREYWRSINFDNQHATQRLDNWFAQWRRSTNNSLEG